MKTLSFTILLVAFCGLLVYTNPTMDDYHDFVQQQIQKEMVKSGDSIDRFWGSVMGGIGSAFIVAQTIRTDYVVCSLYQADFGEHHLKVLGILKNFFILEKSGGNRS